MKLNLLKVEKCNLSTNSFTKIRINLSLTLFLITFISGTLFSGFSFSQGTSSALNFDGVDDGAVITNPYYQFSKEITVEWWISPASFEVMGSGIGQSTPNVDQMNTNVWLMHFNGSGTSMNFYVNDGGTWRTHGSVNIPMGWHHVVGVADANSTRLYIDGVLQSSGAGISGTILNNPNSQMHFGKDVRYNIGRFGNMSIDEVRVWNRALCLGEIQNYNNCEIPTSASGLVGNYHCNQGVAGSSNPSEIILFDASGNNRNASLTGFALNGSTSNWVSPGGVINGTSCPAYVAPAISASSNSPVTIGSSLNLASTSGFTSYAWSGPNGYTSTSQNPTIANVAIAAAGTYTVKGINASGCSNTAATSVSVNSQPASALSFGAASDYVDLGSPLASNASFTKEGWIYSTDANSANNLFSTNQDPIWIPGGKLNVGQGNNYGVITDPDLFPMNTWTHVAITYDQPTSTLKLYVNGILKASNSSAPAFVGGQTYLGQHPLGGGQSSVKMDEVRFWNRALCQGEIQNNMNGELNPAGQTGLVRLFRFNQGYASATNSGITTLTDATGNGNGTLYNFSLNGASSNWIAPGAIAIGSSNPTFVTPAISASSNSPVNAGGSLNLASTSGFASYAWTGPNGFTSTSQNPVIASVTSAAAGSYSVQGTYASGCSNTASTNVVVNVVAPSISNCPQTQYQQIYTSSSNCTAVFTYNPTISGSPAPTVSYTFSGATTGNGSGTGSGSAFNVGQTTVAITATNQAGTVNCSFVVTVVDNVAPTAIAKNINVYLNSTGQASIAPQDINNGSYDNCGNVTMTLSQNGIICGTGTENQNITLTAPAGALITGIDFASYGTPNGSCGNFTLGSCNAANSIAIVQNYALNHNSAVIPASNGVFGDPCGGTVKRLYIQAKWTGTGSATNFNCANLGNNNVNLIVTDANGNVSTAASVITVLDTIKPLISVSANISSFATSAAGALVNYTLPTATDNCSATVSLVSGLASGSVFPIGTTTVTYKATDASGNFDQASFTVTVSGVAPQIACPSNITINNTIGQCGTNVSFAATETIGVPASTITYSPVSGSLFSVGTTTVTATATNAVGTSSCTFSVTVVDNQAPTIACAGNVTVNAANSACSANVTVPVPTASDNCTFSAASIQAPFSANDPSLSLWIDATKFSANNGASVSGIIDDASGFNRSLSTNATYETSSINGRPAVRYNNNQTATSSFNTNGNTYIFTTVQLVAPSTNWASVFYHWNRDAGLTIEQNPLSPSGAPAGAARYHFQTGNDNYNVEQNITYGTNYIMVAKINGGNVRSFTLYKDNNGVLQNLGTSTNSSYSLPIAMGQLFIGKSDAGEYTNMKMGEFLYFQGSLPATESSIVNYLYSKWFGGSSVTLTNNFNNTANASGTYPVGTTNVVWTATDASGNTSNCQQSVTVVDNQAPVISVTTNINTVATSAAGAIVNYVVPVATDNCSSIPTVVATPSSGSMFPLGLTNVTVSATDNAGNTSQSTFTVNVSGLAPQIACPSNITVNNDLGQCGANVSFTATETTGIPASTITYSPASGSFFPVGTTQVTATATNAVGTSTCTFEVTVIDNLLPTVITQNQTISLDASGNASINISMIDNGSFDNCGIASMSLSKTAFDCSNFGANTVVLTITDIHGNVSTANAVVTVEDHIAPIVIAQDLTISLDASGSASITAAQINNGSSDACEIATMSVSPDNFSCSNFGANTVVLTVTDIHGNVSTASAVVTVEDHIAPIAIAQDLTISLDASGSASITAAQINNGSSDACGIATMSVSPDNFSCSNFGANTVVLTVTDIHGNVSTANAVVTVEDHIAPIAIAQDLTVSLDASGSASITAAQINNGSSDACGIATMSVSPDNFSCSNFGANTVILTVTDIHGNVSTASAVVIVEDHIAPIATAQDLTISLDASGSASISAAQINNGSSDACGIATMSVSPDNFSCATFGANTVVLTVTDIHGNASTASAVVTVEDHIAPVVVTKNISVTLSSGSASITASQVNNGSSDACGIASLAVSPSTFNCSNLGANTVTLTVTDIHGNVSSSTATVSVIGAIPTVSIAQSLQPAFTQGGAIILTASSPTAIDYAWTGGPANEIYNVYASGTYTVVVTNSYGCTFSASSAVNYVPSNILSNYTIIGKKEAELEDHSYLYNGGMGATDVKGEAELEKSSFATATGTFVRAAEIEIKDGSAATTKIYSAVPLSILPAFLSNPYSSNNNKNIAQNAVVTINDSLIGELVIGKNAKVTFTSTRIYVKGMNIGEGAVIKFLNCAEIRVKNEVNLHKSVSFNKVSPRIVTLYLGGDLHVEEGAQVEANVYSAKKIEIHGSSSSVVNMKGMFIADEVKAEKYVNFYWNTASQCGTVQRVAENEEETIVSESSISSRIYPNPSNNLFNLQISTPNEAPYTVYVMDVSGKILNQKTELQPTEEFQFGEDLSNGVYFVKIIQGDYVQTIKIIKVQ